MDRAAVLEDFLAVAVPRVPLDSWGVGKAGLAAIKVLVRELTPADRVALLKAAVAELPRIPASTEGALLYATVGALYGARLPLGEDDLCELLRSAGHECGHGLDTRPPFDLARTYLRQHGYSPAIGAAIAEFIANLPKSTAIQINELRRSAAVIALLGPDPVGRPGSWVRGLQGALASLGPPERAVWENLVVAMSVSERMVMPNTWRAPAEAAVAALGPEGVARRLTEWWPDSAGGAEVNLQDGGAQVVKHFIWLLDFVPRADGEPLVVRLAGLRFKGRDEPMAVLKPAAAYLEPATGPEASAARAHLLARIG